MPSNLPALTGDASKDLQALTGDPRQDMPQAEPRVIRAPVSESKLGILGGAIKDTLGLGRDTADPLGRAVYDPKGAERLLLPAISAPVVAAGGLGAAAGALRTGAPALVRAVAPALGRAATQAGIGATRDAARSESKDAGGAAARGAVIDGLTALAFEGLVPGLTHLPKANLSKAAAPLASQEAGYAWATKAPLEALAAITDRLKGITRISVPSMGGKVAPGDAAKQLAKLEGPAYQKARYEIADAMNAVDRSGASKKAGDLFLEWTKEARYAPVGTAGQKLAKGAIAATKNPAVRAAVDAGAATEADRDVPAGPVAAAGAASQLGRVGRYVGGMGH